MRFEFYVEGTMVGAAQWEGPGQVTLDVPDAMHRERLQRYFSQETTYFSTPFADDEDALQDRRRDWTPWEFERACTALAWRMGYRVQRTPSQAVEAREKVS